MQLSPSLMYDLFIAFLVFRQDSETEFTIVNTSSDIQFGATVVGNHAR